MTKGKKKIEELIVYIASRSQDDPNFGMTKLNKELFYSDFLAYKYLGKAITGTKYIKLKHGPIMDGLDLILADLEDSEKIAIEKTKRFRFHQKKVIALEDANLEIFTSQEISLVDKVIQELWPLNALSVSSLTHAFIGWRLANEGEEIPYQVALVLDPRSTRQKITDTDIEYGEELQEFYA